MRLGSMFQLHAQTEYIKDCINNQPTNEPALKMNAIKIERQIIFPVL